MDKINVGFHFCLCILNIILREESAVWVYNEWYKGNKTRNPLWFYQL